MKKIVFSILISIVCIALSAQTSVNTFVQSPSMKRANISFLVKEIETGRVVVQHRADKVAVPASTAKIVTTATALEILGPDYTFQTKLEYDGAIENGVLNGNIYIIGGGDPTLGSKYLGDSLFLEKWVEAVKNLGITKINGNILPDASIFSKEGIAPKWSWEDMGNYYAAGAYGLSIYDNAYKIYFKSAAPGTTPEIIKVEPKIPGLGFELYLKAAANNEDSAYIYGAPFNNTRLIYGTIPAHQTSFEIKGDIPDPAQFTATVFTNKLKETGIEVLQSATTQPISNNHIPIYTEVSPPLKEIIKNINFKSNNHYAEHVLRAISLYSNNQGSIVNSVQNIKNFWKSKGIDNSGLILYDGCGLSASNAISASFFVDLLIYEKTKSNYSKEFLESLPIAGQSGTIKSLLKGTPLEGKVQAKSGSIYGVQCFAGYITKNNKQYAFAILVNNYSGTRKTVVKQIENLLLSVDN